MLSEKPWTVERVMLLLLSGSFCLMFFGALQLLVMHFSKEHKLDENSVAYVIFEILSIHGSILAATGIVVWWCEISWQKAFGFARWSTGRSLFWGGLTAVVFLPVGGLLKTLSLGALKLLGRGQEAEQEAIQTLQNTHNPASLALLVLFAVLIAPVAEEILFRGILYPAIKRLGFPKTALWSTSIVFAAIHGNWPIFVPLLVLGLALALLYERTDNLLAPITAHAVFNTVNVIFFFLEGGATHGAQGWFQFHGP